LVLLEHPGTLRDGSGYRDAKVERLGAAGVLARRIRVAAGICCTGVVVMLTLP
jgi:hypothetical protein